jgi:hypothetical protein
MSDAMTGVVLELRQGIGRWLLLPLVALGVFAAEGEIPPGPAIWPLVVSALGTSVELMGPLAAGAAAFAGSRSKRQQTDAMEQLASRSALAAGLAELGALLAWVLAAFVIVVAIVFVRAALTATWSGPDPARTIAAAAGLLLEVTVGFVAGRLVPRRFTPLVVAVALFALVAYNTSIRSGFQWSLLTPVNLQQYDQFDRLNHAAAAGQLLWYCGIGTAAVAAWGLVRSRSRAVLTAFVIASVVAVCGAVILIDQHGRSNQPGVTVTWKCTGARPQLCIHPSLTTARGKLRATFTPIADRLQGTSFQPSRLEQRPRGLGGTPTFGAVAFALDDTSTSAIRLAAQDVAVNALGLQDACFTATGPKSGYLLAQLVGSWVAGDPSLFVPATDTEVAAQTWFSHLSAAQKRAWMRKHETAVRRCNLAPSDFR